MQDQLQQRKSSPSSQQSLLQTLNCEICPHFCFIPSGGVGKCNVIKNADGKLENIYEGHCSNIALEPIEKRPIFHVLPGSKFLSVGFFGCSFSCKFCLNFTVSQQFSRTSKYYSPQDLVALAEDRNAAGIAFTYNEPTLYHNYIEEVGHEIGCRNLPMKLVVKTNGFVNQYVIRNLCLYADAINVDLKGNDQDYRDVCGGWLEPVADCIEHILNMEVHLEISYLVLPSRIDDMAFNVYFRNWLADLDPYVPVHLLYFYPFYKMNTPSYKPSKLIELAQLLEDRLYNVYISNHFGEGLSHHRDTVCRHCGNILISRQKSTIVHSLSCCNNAQQGLF